MPRTPQPLHIFRKDLMHLWPETLVVLALFVACAWSAPSRWTGNEYVTFIGILSIFLKAFLMPISWLVVISRLIQDESLVGDRQFWTSRPYHWPSLIAAKVLYLLAFLYLPFLLMQIYLLKHAGLYPTTAIPALLHNLVLLTVIVVIPIAAISAVTSTFPRALLGFIGAVIYLIIIAVLVTWIVIRRMPPPALQPVVIALFILLPAIALIYQYATRRTAISRGILVATPLLIAILLFITPATALIRHAYPVASAPKLGQLPAEFGPQKPQAGNLTISHDDVQLGIPFTIDSADKDSSYAIGGVAATIDAPGVHWSTPYITAVGNRIGPGIPFSIVPVVMPLSIFNQVGHSPADVHLSVAVQQFKSDPPSTWKATQQPFAVPGHGICSFSTERPDDPPTCSYPFKAPDVNFITAPLAPICGDPSVPKRTAFANLSDKVGFLDFDPVVTEPLEFSFGGQKAASGYYLCPGTPLTITEAHQQSKNRLEVDEKQLLLENYATHTPPRTRPDARPSAEPPPPDQQ
jgi:hypothetical protein